MPNQQNSDPNLVGGKKKKKKESPSTNDNNTQEKGIKGSNNRSNSNNSSSPAPAPLPKVKDSNVPQKETAPAAENSGGGGNENVDSKGGKENKENEMKIVSQSTTNETCDEKKNCKDDGGMVGCISKIGIHLAFGLFINSHQSMISLFGFNV